MARKSFKATDIDLDARLVDGRHGVLPIGGARILQDLEIDALSLFIIHFSKNGYRAIDYRNALKRLVRNRLTEELEEFSALSKEDRNKVTENIVNSLFRGLYPIGLSGDVRDFNTADEMARRILGLNVNKYSEYDLVTSLRSLSNALDGEIPNTEDVALASKSGWTVPELGIKMPSVTAYLNAFGSSWSKVTDIVFTPGKTIS